MTAAPSSHAAALAEQPFLSGLDRTFLEALAGSAEERTFATGEPIAREGDAAHEFYLLLEGKVGLEVVAHDRPRLTVLTLGPGDVFGWSWLAAPYRWRVDVRAMKPTRAYAIPSDTILKAFETHPTAAYQFLRRLVPVLAQRLDATWLQVLDVHHA
jgi:CRP/FNR family cyclic AMP-dependent transcriptional regulator